ncbi:MAG: hypothetical protein ABIR96_06295 [Bdellovibrionota bacterium]
MHQRVLILAFFLTSGLSGEVLAATCPSIPANTYAFVKSQLLAKIKRDHLTLAKGRDLSSEYAKDLGMLIEESGGDAAKLAIHGHEDERGSYTKIKDWEYEPNIYSTVKEVDTNIETFIDRTNFQTNFGISQLSPDQAVYQTDNHKFVKKQLLEIQALIRADTDAAIKRCGADLLFKNSHEELVDGFKKIANCNPVLDLRVTKSQSTPINDETRLRCFARIAMLCPGIHFDVLNNYPRRNWGSANAPRKCTEALEQEVVAYFGSGDSRPATIAAPSKDH